MKDLKIVGDIFLSLLKMIIVPLVFTSVFIAMLGLGDISRFKDMGLRTLAYYVVTTSLSVITGLILVNVFEPGKGNELVHHGTEVGKIKELSFEDVLWNIIPTNPVKSFVEGKVLQIIFFSVLLGLATLAVSKEKMRHVFNLFDGLNDGLINLTGWIVKLTPIGVFSLVGFIVADMGVDIIITDVPRRIRKALKKARRPYVPPEGEPAEVRERIEERRIPLLNQPHPLSLSLAASASDLNKMF